MTNLRQRGEAGQAGAPVDRRRALTTAGPLRAIACSCVWTLAFADLPEDGHLLTACETGQERLAVAGATRAGRARGIMLDAGTLHRTWRVMTTGS